ncbi:MAG: diadenylate cyclase CdaA [Spirochaetales bacterium]|nr:diadenylate cyclase CdaA [Spirochaetales bacterium]
MDWLLRNWFFRTILRPGLDILLLTFIIYKVYQILVQTKAIQLLKGTLMLILIILVTFLLNLKTLSWIFRYVGPSIIVFLAVIFQPELRKIFTKIGQDKWFRFSSRAKKYHFESVINSVEILAARKCGSLIVLARNIGLKNIIETGTRLNAVLSTTLILTVFTEDAPLHDGAIIIKEDQIIAAGCFLPLSEQIDIRKSFGTRHRAALGLAEETDAVVIVVSEETGAISLAYDAHLLYDLSIEEISNQIKMLFEYSEEDETDEVKIES